MREFPGVVQWLGCHTYTAVGLGLLPGWETMNEESEYCGLTPSFAEVPLSDTALVNNDSHWYCGSCRLSKLQCPTCVLQPLSPLKNYFHPIFVVVVVLNNSLYFYTKRCKTRQFSKGDLELEIPS